MQDIKLWIINSYISDYLFRPKPIKPLCVSAKGLGPLSPGVDLVADTKKNLENRLTW